MELLREKQTTDRSILVTRSYYGLWPHFACSSLGHMPLADGWILTAAGLRGPGWAEVGSFPVGGGPRQLLCPTASSLFSTEDARPEALSFSP